MDWVFFWARTSSDANERVLRKTFLLFPCIQNAKRRTVIELIRFTAESTTKEDGVHVLNGFGKSDKLSSIVLAGFGGTFLLSSWWLMDDNIWVFVFFGVLPGFLTSVSLPGKIKIETST